MANQKESYRLGVEYLRRSDDYKEYCEWKLAKHEDPSLPDPDKVKIIEKSYKFNKIKEIIYHPCASNFSYFRNIHTIGFDEWWGWKKERLSPNRDIRNRIPGPIEDFMEGWLLRDLNGCIDGFVHKKHRQPSAIELRDFFVDFLKRYTLRNKLLLQVDLECKLQDIKTEFKKIMHSAKVKRKIAEAQPFRLDDYRYSEPTSKPRIDDLQKYLDIYDMWKDKVKNRKPGDPSGWDEIIHHFEPHRNICNENDRRLYQDYKKRAENIISNVEAGCFPGKY